MADEDAGSNLENRFSATELPVPNINKIWDFRRLLRSSQERLQKLRNTSSPDHGSIQLERAIIRGVSKEIRRMEKKVLCPDIL